MYERNGATTTLTLRIHGMETRSPNNVRFASRKGMFAESTRKKAIRDRTRLELQSCMFRNRVSARRGLPSRITIIRYSSGVGLDHGNLWASQKEVIDGIADALELKSDKELQDPARMSLLQSKCKRGEHSIEIRLSWDG